MKTEHRADLQRLLEELIEIPSPTGEEGAVAAYLERLLVRESLKVERQWVDEARFNLLARAGADPVVLFCTHLDTVSPHIPFSCAEGTVRGRGACDAKGSLAAMVAAAKRLLADEVRHFGFLLLVGEERDSDGAKAAAKAGKGAEYILLGEPTGNRVATGQKGTLVLRVTAKGVAGHSAYPSSGRSAIHSLVEFLSESLKVDWGAGEALGTTTLNWGTLRGGAGSNVIAAEAAAEGIIRIGTSLGEVRQRLESLRPQGIAIEELSAAEPLFLETVPGFAETVVAFGSDAPYLRPLGRVVLCGPGSIQYAHSDDERITLEELEESVEIYTALVNCLIANGRR